MSVLRRAFRVCAVTLSAVFAMPAFDGASTAFAQRGDRDSSAGFTSYPMRGTETRSFVRSPALLRMMIAANPLLLDHMDVARSVFESEGRKFTSQYRVEAELASFKKEYLSRPTPERVRLSVEYQVGLRAGAYRAKDGLFPFNFIGLDKPTRFVNLRMNPFSNQFPLHLDLEGFPDVAGIPMTLSEAEAFERREIPRFNDTRYAIVRARIEVAGVTFDPLKNRFEAKTRLFAVDVQGEKQRELPPKIYHEWKIEGGSPASAPQAGPRDAVWLAREMGDLRVLEGHVVLDELGRWRRLGASLLLANNPKLLDDDRMAIAIGRDLLKPDEITRLWRGRPPSAFETLSFSDFNEFDLRDVAQRIRSGFRNQIAARTVQAPFKAAFVRPATAGRYDFDRKRYSLQYYRGKDVKLSAQAGATVMEASLATTLLPEDIPMDEATARQLDATFARNKNRNLYLVIYADVPKVSFTAPQRGYVRPYRVGLDLSVTRIALYSDPAATRLVFDYYIDGQAELLRRQQAANEIFRYVNMETASLDVVHKVAARLTDNERYVSTLIESTVRESRLNPVEAIDLQQRLTDGLKALQPPAEFWITAQAELGSYDLSSAAFPIRGIRINYRRSDLGPLPEQIASSMTGEIRQAPVPVEAARQLLQLPSIHQADLRLLVTPVHARWEADSSGRPKTEIVYHVKQAVALVKSERDDSGYRVMWSHDFGPYKGAQGIAETKPQNVELGERPVFNQELAALLALKEHGGSLPDAVFRKLIASRWIIERAGAPDVGLPVKFFEDGASLPPRPQIDLLKRQFESWLRGVNVTTPKKLKLDFVLADGNRFIPEPARKCSDVIYNPSNWNDEMARAISNETVDVLRQRQHNEIYAGSDKSPAAVKNAILTFQYEAVLDCDRILSANPALSQMRYNLLGRDANSKARVFVIVDGLPMPHLAPAGSYNKAELDVEVREIRTLKRADDVPDLIVHAAFEKVSYTRLRSAGAGQIEATPALVITKQDLIAGEPAHDVLGVRPGMTEREAAALLVKHFGQPVVLRSSTPPSPAVGGFQNAVMYLKPDHKERVSLYFEEEEGDRRVLAVERIIVAPNWSLPRADVSNAAIAKYGKPTTTNHTDYLSKMTWGKTTENIGCRNFYDSSNARIEDWADVQGKIHKVYEYFNWNIARDTGLGYVPDLNVGQSLKACGQALIFRHRQDSLSVLLVDVGAYMGALEQTRERARQKIESGNQAGSDRVKL